MVEEIRYKTNPQRTHLFIVDKSWIRVPTETTLVLDYLFPPYGGQTGGTFYGPSLSRTSRLGFRVTVLRVCNLFRMTVIARLLFVNREGHIKPGSSDSQHVGRVGGKRRRHIPT